MSREQKWPAFDASRDLLSRAISRPVSVVAVVMLVLFFGALSVFELPIQLTPDITRPTISVSTTWPGASPVEVEAEILEEQEEVLRSVQGLTRMESTARQSNGEITLEFEVGTELDTALVRVSNQLSQVPSYPQNVDQPVVSTANAAGPPLAVIIIRSEHPSVSPRPYRTWVEEEITPQLERIPGVASVFMRGGQRTEMHVEFDIEALAARGITVSQVTQRIRGELADVSAGDFDVGKRRMVVRTMLAPEEAPDLERLVVATGPDQTPILLADVADVSLGLRKATDFAIADDDDAIALLPRREAGFNVLEVTEEVRATVLRLDEEEFDPEGLTIEVVDDQVDYILGALDVVRSNLLIGAILAVIVLLVFLRRLTAAGIIALAIPVCVLGTAIGMAALGRSINVVSLAGLTFAIGMVIDNSIVALENIDTWSKRVSDRRQAAWLGIKEVAGALLASTATTAAVFVPIILWQGEVGEILRDVAYAISLSVIISFFVAVLVIPSLAAVLVDAGEQARSADKMGIASWGERVRESISRASGWLGAGWVRSSAVVVIAVGLAVFVAWALLPKMEYLPNGNRNLVFSIILPPPGYSVDELERIGTANQKQMVEHTGVSKDGVPALRRSFFVGDPSFVLAGGVAEDPEQIRGIRDYMQKLNGSIPGAISFASQASLFANGIGEGRAVEIELSGPDLEAMIGLARKLFGQVQSAIPGARVRPVPVLDLGAPEFRVRPRRDEVSDLGVNSAELAAVVDTYIDGRIIGEWGPEGEPKIDVVLRAARPDDATSEDDLRLLRDAPVATSRGDIVPFGILAEVTTELGPTVIQRAERRRSVVLQVTPPDDVAFETAIETIEQDLLGPLEASGEIPSGIDVNLGGSAGKLADAQLQFGWVLLIALLISFLLLAALFEDFFAPIVVLVTVPLAAAGGVVALLGVDRFVNEQPLDLMTAIGFLILIGVVVNNAILIVDGAIARLRDGETLADAVTGGVRSRVRAIFMSTLTSLAGLMPMALSTGAGSELYRGVGAIMLGGLAVATILSLFVVPALFSLVWRLRRAVFGESGRWVSD
ncbi:MAG: efflux RND transporter permease subunit [Myxococcota bacterium]